MIAPKLHTLVTFDRSVIRSNWSRMNRRPLGRAGMLVRRIARGSIRRRKAGKYSPAGSPPFSHWPGGTPPFKMIYSVPDRLGTSEVVGMVGFGGSPPTPGLHEHGGTAVRGTFLTGPRKGQKLVARYRPRPFMAPALKKGRDKMPQYWRGALSR